MPSASLNEVTIGIEAPHAHQHRRAGPIPPPAPRPLRLIAGASVSKAMAAEPRCAEELGPAVGGQAFATKRWMAAMHLVGVLAGHEPAGDLHRGLGGNDRLGADALVAAGDAVEFERRPRPELLEHAKLLLAGRLREADRRRGTLRPRKPSACHCSSCSGGWLLSRRRRSRGWRTLPLSSCMSRHDAGQRADRVDAPGRRRCPNADRGSGR